MSEITDKLRAMNPWKDMDWPETVTEAADYIDRLEARVAVLEVFATNITMWWDAVSSGQWGAEEERFGWTGALDSHGAMLAFAARRALTPVAETPNQDGKI